MSWFSKLVEKIKITRMNSFFFSKKGLKNFLFWKLFQVFWKFYYNNCFFTEFQFYKSIFWNNNSWKSILLQVTCSSKLWESSLEEKKTTIEYNLEIQKRIKRLQTRLTPQRSKKEDTWQICHLKFKIRGLEQHITKMHTNTRSKT